MDKYRLNRLSKLVQIQCMITAFLVDADGYLTAFVCHELSSQLNYQTRNYPKN